MPEGWTITTKEGDTLTIEEWLEKKDEKHGFNPEFSKLQKKEVISQRKCLRRRIVKNGISPEYENGHSEVRYLTEEEIKKEYKVMKERTKGERGETIRELVKFLKELEGRKVATDIIVGKIKKPVKSVSSFLSQLFNASIVARKPLEGHKRKFLWGLSNPYLKGDLEAIISTFNEFIAEKRRNQYLKSKGESDSVKVKEYVKVVEEQVDAKEDPYLTEAEIQLLKLQENLSKSREHTLKIIVEGNIKILFGLVK